MIEMSVVVTSVSNDERPCRPTLLAPLKRTYIEAHRNTESIDLSFQFQTFFLLHRPTLRSRRNSTPRLFFLKENPTLLTVEMKIRNTLQASAFSFIALNLVEKAVLHILLIMDYIKSALRSRQQITSNAENF